jgi:hypothetical protein
LRGHRRADLSDALFTLMADVGGRRRYAARLGGQGLAGMSRQTAAMQASGMTAALGFQYCGGRLLDGVKLSEDTALQPGDGVLAVWEPFAWRGRRDVVVLRRDPARSTFDIAA